MHWFRRVKFHQINVHFLFFYVFWLYAMIFLSFDIVFISSSMILQNICLNNSRKILNNSRRRISINVFSIYLIISTESDYSLIIYINFLNLFVISTISTELNLINFIFLNLTAREFKLMSMRIFFIAMFARRTSINFKSLLKTILFIRFIAFK